MLIKKNITFYPNFSGIISLVLVLFITWISGIVTTSYAQSPWTQKTDKPTARMSLSTSVVDGIIYAIGGSLDVHQPAYETVEAYDPKIDAWTTKAPMPTPRASFSTCVVDGIIYAIGGAREINSAPFSTVEAYDPATNTWTTKRDMPTPRVLLSTSVVDGIIYAIGGASDNASPPFSTVEAYDPATNTWTTKRDMPNPISAFSTCAVDGIIYAIGGGFNVPGSLSTVKAYDPKTDTWTEKDDMPTPRATLSTCAVDGIIYAIGGRINAWGYISTVEAYDPVKNTWMKKTAMPTGRSWLSSSTVDGKIYAIGGFHGVTVATVEEYDPHSDLFALIEKFNVSKSCVKAGIDSVCITAKMNDPTGITLLAEIEAPDQTPIDILELFDDGNHNDESAGDSLYANVWPVSSAEEHQYYVDLKVTRVETDTVIKHKNNIATFSTIDLITLEDYTFTSNDTEPNPGDRIKLELTLKNNSTVATATGIRAGLISLDTLVSILTGSRPYDDITASENSTSVIYTIKISEECPVNIEVPIVVNISSYDHICWSDTFSIMVQEPVNIEDIRDPITRIYPNPTNNMLNIDISNTGKQGIEIEILTVIGRVIYQKEYKNINVHFVEQLDLSGYTKGIYLVKIKQANTVYVGKVVLR
jgi:N-acetylneuraminic acid mutarotase